MLTVLPEAPTLDVVSDQLPLVFHPEPLLHEDDPVLEDDDVRQVERVRDVVRKEPLPNVLVALVFSEEEPVKIFSRECRFILSLTRITLFHSIRNKIRTERILAQQLTSLKPT